MLLEKNSNLHCTLDLTCSKKSGKYGRNLSSGCLTKSHFLPSLRLIYKLHTPIKFSIGYNAKKSKVSHLLQIHGPESDPGFGGMWQPIESATDPGIFMSSLSLRKRMTFPAIWHPKNSSCSESQTGMTDRLVVALHTAKQSPTESFTIWNLSPPGTSGGLKYIEQCSLFSLHCIQHLLRTLYF